MTYMENDDFNKGCLVDRETRTKEKKRKNYTLDVYNLSELSEKDRLYDGFVRIESL